ncbi:phosphate ABC transporter permease PstA [Actinocorallia sp. API 0066]|uniref:phosphate ABC transporter permease PstA n=1 Tax=Actinocorallia sp. API 0066 TaxID=2896846 RepID=UPI001E59C71A|nr:phosphate ABC transporter permease PstA [Actinocorallia sp. API 0066]MCD0448393.1 phosphate ABC transporter permease PstA [Actinocorallia sp. API 0066]
MTIADQRTDPSAAEAPPTTRGRFRPGGAVREDRYALVGAAAASLALVWILFTRLLPFTGALGFAVCWYGAFLVLYTLVVTHEHGRLAALDRLVSVLVHSAGVLTVTVIAAILGFTVLRGAQAFAHSNFFTQTMSDTGALDPLTSGGVLHAVVGSLIQLGIGVAIAVPLGIATALFLVEVGGRLTRPVRLIVDTMSALPSVLAGLFVLAAFILTFGFQKSGLAAALAIAIMMVPIVTRASEVVLRLVPGGLREAAYALGAGQWQVVWRVVLPTARSGLATGVVLAMARGVGETAPVLLTAGFARGMNADPFSGNMTNLPLYIYTYVKFPQPDMVSRAFGAALVLALVVLVLFTVARLLGGAAPGQMTRRARRRLAKADRAAAQAPVPAPSGDLPLAPDKETSA